jgi:hypothetical protein
MLDELDKFIFYEIFKAHENNTTANSWEIAKNYAKLIKEKRMDRVYCCIKYRLRSYSRIGLFSVKPNGNGRNMFIMNLDAVTFKKIQFSDGKKLSIIFRM